MSNQPAVAQPAPPRIGLWQALGNCITCVGTTANKLTEVVIINGDTAVEASNGLNIMAKTGTKYAKQFEVEADIALSKKRALLAAQEELETV